VLQTLLNRFAKKQAKHQPQKPSAFIEINDVSKRYGSIVALSKINCQINQGEFLSLVGPSGAGKSTLIRLLIREELPTVGQIFVANRDITRLSRRELPFYRRKIGVVFQDFKLLIHKNVWENISFALEVCDAPSTEIQEKVLKILKLVSLDKRSYNYPHELSGGEKQRVSIARALIHNPKILIADEPTGNLDPLTTEEIINLLLQINKKGTTIILATHNKGIVDRLNRRVITMKGGEVVSDQESGKYELIT
jgi:cell division transport system ATP-binding protein